jgi:peptidyl-prolyl cis-trans isomerase C
MDIGLEQPFLGCFHRCHRVANAAPGVIELADLRMGSRHSAYSSASQGGNLGQITAGQTTPEFERALLALEPGSIGPEPIATRYGFHIVRLDRRHEGRALPFELVAERIAAYLQDCVQRRALAQYVARLASAARIDGIDLAGTEALRVA